MKKKIKVKVKKIRLIDVVRGIRKSMPPPSSCHTSKKYKRPRKEWTTEEE
jgi:hypothetical protein